MPLHIHPHIHAHTHVHTHTCPHTHTHTHTHTPVQDVAFHLERLVSGMYVYYRQSHKALKPAAVFPIEVELQTEMTSKPQEDEETDS